MTNNPTKTQTFTDAVRKWIIGKNISIYLRGREKPMTNLTVCQVSSQFIIARWNSSTHIFPAAQIICIRYGPDCDPCRDITHPLSSIVRHRATTTALGD